MRAIVSFVLGARVRSRRLAPGSRPWRRRFALVLSAIVGLGACSTADAGAFTLTLAFPDGQPMTYGSACAGVGCMMRSDHVNATDENGRINLPTSTQAIEWRRDGIPLAAAPIGVASGTTVAVGTRATVTLPRMLVGSDPAVDAEESDLVARLNEVRAAQGLPMAQMNPQLTAAADLQAAWLTQSGAGLLDPGSFHDGPFGSDLAFRHGEVSMPEPDSGGEIAEAGATIDETVTDWLSSEEHRREVLAPGQLLIGVGRVGSFTIVETHKPCKGCAGGGTGTRDGAPPPSPAVVPAPPPPPPPPAAAPTIGSSTPPAAPRPGCGREQLSTRRLQARPGAVRLRVSIHCLRPGARYTLLIRQGASGRTLKSLRISRAGKTTLSLRPSPTVNSLRVRLKRDGHVIAVRTTSLR
jgi:uncharacterized protein YkwD